MKQLKKIISGILVACFLLGGLSACKKEEKTSSVLTQDGKFVPQKDMDITVWVTQGSDYVPPVEAKENLVGQWLQDKTRVKIKNTYGNGGGQWEGVLARLIAGNNFPELVACGGGQGPAHFAKIAEADKIWELTPEMLQKYAPDVWESVPQAMWERMKVNGKIYGVPYNFPVDRRIDPDISDEEIAASGKVYTDVGTSIWIRDDILQMLYPDALSYNDMLELLEKEGKPIGDYIYDVPIESTEDVVKLMKDIDALDLKVGKKDVYTFGYAGADCWQPLALLGAQLMGYVGHHYISSWDTKNEKIIIPLLDDVVKEGALLQNQLLREGIIDPDSLVHTDAQFKEKVLNGQYAMAIISAAGHPPFVNDTIAKSGKDFRYRPLYTKVKTAEGYDVTEQPLSWGDSVGILKTVKEEDLPQILNWMNVQFTDEWEEIRNWGPKDAGLYVENEDGTRTFVNDEFNKKYIYHQENNLNDEDCMGLDTTCGPFTMKFKLNSKWNPMIYNKVATYGMVPEDGGKFSPDSEHVVTPVPAPPSDVWAAEYAELDTVIKFWSSRSQWEDPFKLTLVAKSDEEFDKKWEAAIKNMKDIVDVDKMAEDMTKIAKETLK
ncbi:MAG: hypothetical protein E7412_01060 [Ruminococcaceae bacterium]|nr:hypothetical protein [Oscillospiraceae bacterium]